MQFKALWPLFNTTPLLQRRREVTSGDSFQEPKAFADLD